MRLYVSSGSPFARKCRIVLRERGLEGRVEETPMAFPYKEGDEFLRASPMGQVPAMIAEDGLPIANSPVICAYLDSIGTAGPRLLPPDGPEHWRVRRLETVGDSVLEMAVKLALEGRRPETERSSTWIGWWTAGLNRALDQAEEQAGPPEPLDLGKIALGVAGPYVDFRLPQLNWRASRPRLSALCDALDQRPSFAATRPS